MMTDRGIGMTKILPLLDNNYDSRKPNSTTINWTTNKARDQSTEQNKPRIAEQSEKAKTYRQPRHKRSNASEIKKDKLDGV